MKFSYAVSVQYKAAFWKLYNMLSDKTLGDLCVAQLHNSLTLYIAKYLPDRDYRTLDTEQREAFTWCLGVRSIDLLNMLVMLNQI